MSRACAVAAVVLTLWLVQPGSVRIVMDGEFDDWTRVAVTLKDPVDPSSVVGPAFDIRETRFTSDDRYLYLLLDLERAVGLQSMTSGSLSILVDQDAVATTGETILGMAGVDWSAEIGQGVTVRKHGAAAQKDTGIPLTETGFLFAPRIGSSRFEFRLDRTASTRAIVKLSFGQGPTRRDETEAIPVTLPELAQGQAAAAAASTSLDPLRRAPGTALRIVSWNVAGMPAAMRGRYLRILRAIDADIVMLDEAGRRKTAPVVAEWLTALKPGDRWQAFVAPAYQGTIVGARGLVEAAFASVTPLEAMTTALLAPMPADVRAIRRWAYDDQGPGAGGAVATIGGRRVLAVPIDLTSGGSPESYNDAARVSEASAISEAIRRARQSARAQAIIVGGDFNLVGSHDPIDVLANSGLDVDGSSLAVARILNLDGRSASTWRPIFGGNFTAGQLDWLLYSDAVLEQVGGFVFDSEHLTPHWLAQHRLHREVSAQTSDHLPLVVDFRWRR